MEFFGPPNYDPDDPPFPPLLGPPASIETGHLALRLRWKLNELQDARFELDTSLLKAVTEKYEKYRLGLRQWFEEATRCQSELEDQGNVRDARWLATALYLDPNFYEQHYFRTTIPLGSGKVMLKVVGSDEKAQPSSYYSIGAPDRETDTAPAGTQAPSDQAHPLSNSGPVEFPLKRVGSLSASVTVSQALRQKLWISWNPSGFAFCMECPFCEELIAPAANLSPGAPTYELVPRQFHTNPFEDDLALHHFELAHQKVFPAGVQEMVDHHGKRVVPDAGGAPLTQWTIEANNLAAQRWHAQVVSSWEALRRKRPAVIRNYQMQVQHVVKFSKVIEDDAASGSYVFPWPRMEDDDMQGSRWVVLCTDPNCTLPTFKEHPFEANRAANHFARHGFPCLEEYQILELFGFRVMDTALDRFRVTEKAQNIQAVSTDRLQSLCARFGIETDGQTRRDMIEALTGRTRKPAPSRHLPDRSPGGRFQKRSSLAVKAERMATANMRSELKRKGISTDGLTRRKVIKEWVAFKQG